MTYRLQTSVLLCGKVLRVIVQGPKSIHGTPSHIPPESWKDRARHRPDEIFDAYSFAIFVWETFTEKKAYEEEQGKIFIDK